MQGRSKAAPCYLGPMSSFQVLPARFEFHRDGNIAFIEYRLHNGVVDLIHTEVPDALRGGGVGSDLVRSALGWIRANNYKARVSCPFVAAYVQRHPEYADLVVQRP